MAKLKYNSHYKQKITDCQNKKKIVQRIPNKDD